MAGQVLDISKHENAVRVTRPGSSGRRARLYRFPAPASVAPPMPKSCFRLHLAVELGIGLLIWLIWFAWQQTH